MVVGLTIIIGEKCFSGVLGKFSYNFILNHLKTD